MLFEISAGAVVFCRHKGKIKYLLLKHSEIYWNFPKGHIESGEGELDAAKREVWEETGIKNIKIVPGFKGEEKYYFRLADDPGRVFKRHKKIFKNVVFFMAETKYCKAKISREHLGSVWCEFGEALKRLKYKASKDILKKADKFLHDHLARKSV